MHGVIHRVSAHGEFTAQKRYATCACTVDKYGENVIHRARAAHIYLLFNVHAHGEQSTMVKKCY